MPFVDATSLPSAKIGKPFERELKVVMSPQTHDEVRGFTMMMSILAPRGGCTDFHTHESSGELMIFMKGTGKAWLDGVEHELKPGVVIFAPPGVNHKTLNTGSESLEIACVFVPAVDTNYIAESIRAAQKAGGSQ